MKEFIFQLQRFATINNTASNTIITGRDDDLDDEDNVINSGNMVGINLGDGNDTVNNTGNLVTISAGDGNNKIDSKGTDVIITAGSGADTITSELEDVTITSGAGNDKIVNNGKNAIITAGGGNNNISSRGENVKITVGNGNDSVVNGYKFSNGNWTQGEGTEDKRNFYDGGQNVSIDLGDGNNYARNISAYYVTITSGSGNDTVYNDWGHFARISVGAGDDSVNNNANDDSVIVTGSGNDTVLNHGDRCTIDTGVGNDYISMSGGESTDNIIKYAYGDGDDTIVGFDGNDTLQITTSVGYQTMKSGGDFYIKFDSGSITLHDYGEGVGSSNFVIIGGGSASATTAPTTSATTAPTTSATTAPTTSATTATTPANSGTTNITNIYNVTNITNVTNNFVSFSGGGNQTISDFVTGNGTNSNVLYFATSLSSMRRTSSAMTFNAADGSVLQVNNSSAADEMIQYTMDGTNVSYAKVGYAEQNNSFTYQDGVNFYAGGEHTDVLNITNAQSRNIWLDGSAGVGYSGVNNIDASNSSGNNTLAGDASNNEIKAGAGSDSLWGGAGDDVLIGGTGTDEFFFGMNDGNDVAQNVGENDVVNLYDVTLEQITAVNTESNFISINTATGSALQVQNSSSLTNTFKLADGSAWKFNRAAGNWQQA